MFHIIGASIYLGVYKQRRTMCYQMIVKKKVVRSCHEKRKEKKNEDKNIECSIEFPRLHTV